MVSPAPRAGLHPGGERCQERRGEARGQPPSSNYAVIYYMDAMPN